MTDVPMKLTASQVSLILQRAAEIDARGDTLSIEELERIATEAGIDAQATRTAIAEFIADEVPPAPAASAPATAHMPAAQPVAAVPETRPATSTTPRPPRPGASSPAAPSASPAGSSSPHRSRGRRWAWAAA